MRTRRVSRWAAFLAALAPATLLGGVAHAGPIPHLCETARIGTIIGTEPKLTGDEYEAICEAHTTKGGYTGLYAAFHNRHPLSLAREQHALSCTAMAGTGTVKHPAGLGDEACSVSDTGLIRATTVIVRKGGLHIAVRYASVIKPAPGVETTALAVAGRLAAT